MEIDWLDVLLSFLGGFGLFLFGMEYMGGGLQKAAGNKMKNLLSVLTSNRLMGVLVGAGVTAVIQSSSAMTVMVVGFVNAGLMSLKQAVGVIMGANIGTTITAWIVALGDWTSFLKPSVLAPVCIVIGMVMLMASKKQTTKHVGEIVFGFGALFLGLSMMSDAAKPLSQLDAVKNIFVALGSNPILGILAGAGVTAVIQSSSASVGILQALATAALVPWNSAIYIILGQNIGTCITAAMSSIGAGKNAKRAAMIHFLFNFVGSVIFAIIVFISFTWIVPQIGSELIDATQISMAHTIFNITNTIVLFPFAGVLVHLAERLVKGDEQTEDSVLMHLDERILETPSFAVENVTKEVMRMGDLASANLKAAIEVLEKQDESKMQEIFDREKQINDLHKGINHYLVKLSNITTLSEEEHTTLTTLFHAVSDIERVGDHADNIAEFASNLKKDGTGFSGEALKELDEIGQLAIESFDLALASYAERNIAKAQRVVVLEDRVDKLEQSLRTSHMKRLTDSTCKGVPAIIFTDAISNIERVSDHAINIAQYLLEECNQLEEKAVGANVVAGTV